MIFEYVLTDLVMYPVNPGGIASTRLTRWLAPGGFESRTHTLIYKWCVRVVMMIWLKLYLYGFGYL